VGGAEDLTRRGWSQFFSDADAGAGAGTGDAANADSNSGAGVGDGTTISALAPSLALDVVSTLTASEGVPEDAVTVLVMAGVERLQVSAFTSSASANISQALKGCRSVFFSV
jgi:hypothetical protein